MTEPSHPDQSEHSIKEECEEETAAVDSQEETGDKVEQTYTEKTDRQTPKRYLPEHKKPDAAPTFPEKLMTLMRYVEKQGGGDDYCIAWCDGGKSFVINNAEEFTRKIIPKFFKSTKFSSFTRKLYRWRFRQINRGVGPDDPIIFGNEFFQRDKEELIAKMRSVTASSTGKNEQDHFKFMTGMKRSHANYSEEEQKRMLLSHYLHQQKHMMQGSLYGGMNPNGSIPLTNALRPGLAFNSQTPSMNTMGGAHMMMIPQIPGQNSASMMMMHQMNIGSSVGNMTSMNAALHSMPPLLQHGPISNIRNRAISQFNPNNSSQPPNAQSTAEIVNAAIAALRQAK